MAKQSSSKDQLFQAVLAVEKFGRTAHSRLSAELRSSGLNVSGWLILKCLKVANDEGLSSSALAAATEMSLAQVAILTKQLLKGHYVRQRTQDHDKRSRHLIITSRGQDQLQAINKQLAKLEQAIKNTIGSEDLQKLVDTIDKLSHVLRET